MIDDSNSVPGIRPHRVLAVGCAVLYLGAAATGTFVAVEVDPGLGLIGLLIVLTTAPICAALLARSRPLAQGARSMLVGSAMPTSNASTLGDVASGMRTMTEQLAMSENALRIVNRHADRDVLRRAIEEEIAAADFDAAIVLIDRLSTEQGLRQEAEVFRHRIDQSRFPSRDADVHEAILQLDELLAQRRWDVASADAGRILRLYPESPRVQRLQERVEQARQAYKAEVERRFLIATREGRNDEAMASLKQLDEFLTEVEAEPYRELARGIISRARDTLGADFKLAVQDRRWPDAAGFGTRLIEEFPNTRMAAEAREVIDGIRERAAGMVNSKL